MTLNALTTIAHLEEFLPGTQPVVFSVLSSKDDYYQWIQTTLLRACRKSRSPHPLISMRPTGPILASLDSLPPYTSVTKICMPRVPRDHQ